jgi:hypothetical protein
MKFEPRNLDCYPKKGYYRAANPLIMGPKVQPGDKLPGKREVQMNLQFPPLVIILQ